MISISYLCLLTLAAISQYVLCDPSPLVIELGSTQAQYEPHQLLRRGPVSVNTQRFSNRGGTYIDASIGTPSQAMRLVLSMTLSDLVVISNEAGICKDRTCDTGATFDQDSSSTFDDLNQTYLLELGSGVRSTGRMMKDILKISGQTIDEMTMLYGIGGNLTYSILGLGYVDGEAVSSQYPNLLAQMKNQGLSNVAAYSIYLDHINSTRGGRLLLGGVDSTKFYDTLETLQIDRPSPDVAWKIQLDSMSIFDGQTTHNITNTNNVKILPEVGTSYLLFPSDILNDVTSLLKATYVEDDDYWVSAKSDFNNSGSMNFQFGQTTIAVPYYDLYADSNATHVWWSIYEGDVYIKLGQPLMRNSYTVVDLTHNQYSIAPFKNDYTTDNLTSIGAAGASGLVGYVQPETPKGGLSTGAKAGIGVGAALGAILVIGMIAFLIVRSRSRREQKREAESGGLGQPAAAAALSTQTHEDKHSSYTGGRPESTAYAKHYDNARSPMISTTPELPGYNDHYVAYGTEREQDREGATSPLMSNTNTSTNTNPNPVYPAYQQPTYQPYSPGSERISSPPPRDSTISPSSPLLSDTGTFRRKPVANQPPSELAG